MTLCGCGCGEDAAPGKRFIHNHHRRGQKQSNATRKAISKALTGRHLSTAHKTTLSDVLTGRHLSEEHKRAIGKGLVGHRHTDESKAKMSISATRLQKEHPERWSSGHETQRGGRDIVNHHYIYDHSDLTKYTMKITRSAHQRLHRLMQISGTIVPHINTFPETEP